MNQEIIDIAPCMNGPKGSFEEQKKNIAIET